MLYYACNGEFQNNFLATTDADALAEGAALDARWAREGRAVYFEVWFNDGPDYRLVGVFGPDEPDKSDGSEWAFLDSERPEPDTTRPAYEMYCKFGRMPFFARDDREAASKALAYGAKHGIKVSVLDMARERPSGRYVGTFFPAWVADTVLHVLGDAAPDGPVLAN